MTSTPRVLLIGDITPFGAGVQYRKALEQVGAEVAHHSDWLGLEQLLGHTWRSRIYRLTRIPLASEIRRHESAIMELCDQFQPEMVVNFKGLHWTREFVERLRQLPCCVINLNHDDFFSRYRSVRSKIQRRAIPAYDRILTTRQVNVDEVRPLNPRVEFFPFAYSPETHRNVHPSPEQISTLTTDVVFVGTFAEHRAQLLEQLVQRISGRVTIHGGGWNRLDRRSPLLSSIASTGVYLDDMCAAFGLAKVALGFLRKENRDEYTQRSFEIPACGGVLLAERTPTHQALYKEGVEADFFEADSIDELSSKVRKLIDDTPYREAMRTAGQQAVERGGNTYCDRAHRLLDILGQWRRDKLEPTRDDAPLVSASNTERSFQ